MMRFVSLSSLSVVFLGLRVSGFDEILGEPGTRAGNGAGSLAQLTNVDFGSAKSSPSPSLLLTTAAATTRTSACVSDSASPARNDLELREIMVTPNPDPSRQGLSQYPTVTTRWVPTILPDGATTYIEIIFTQTFASSPDPLPSPGEGRIGLGDYDGSGGLFGEVKAMSGAASGPATSGRNHNNKVMMMLGLELVLFLGFAGVIRF